MSGSWLRATTRVFFWAWAGAASASSSTAVKAAYSVLRRRLIVGSLRVGSISGGGGRILDQRSPGVQPVGLYSRAMPRIARVLLTVVLALLLPVAVRSADGPIVREGVHENAAYRYEVPARWNGGLVMFAHGYRGEGPGAGSVQSEPLDLLLSERGDAWAATGYRSIGYRVEWFMEDVRALRERFIREVGQPRWTILHGQSLGGHVTIASLEP